LCPDVDRPGSGVHTVVEIYADEWVLRGENEAQAVVFGDNGRRLGERAPRRGICRGGIPACSRVARRFRPLAIAPFPPPRDPLIDRSEVEGHAEGEIRAAESRAALARAGHIPTNTRLGRNSMTRLSSTRSATAITASASAALVCSAHHRAKRRRCTALIR